MKIKLCRLVVRQLINFTMQQPTPDIMRLMTGKPMAPNPPGAPRGLYVIPEWITAAEEQLIVDFLCANQWSDHMSSKRPTQHFGYRYTLNGYQASQEKLSTDWGVLRHHADRLEAEFPGIKIAQCLANAYYKDTGIGAHQDREKPIVFGLSVAGDINMRWTNIQNPGLKYEALIPARSLYIMCEDAAYGWEHGIPVLATVRYPDPTNGDQLTKVLKKPEWYMRASITYRHFNHAIGRDRLTGPEAILLPMAPAASVAPLAPNDLAYMRLVNVVPRHLESEALLFAEIPWVTMKSRFGADLSRLVCGSAEKLSRTAGIYATWVQLYCERVLGIKVEVMDGFANLYPTGKSALPAHRDQYDCWIFGLSFGETRTFDFVSNQANAKLATSTLLRDSPKDIVSLEVRSGDVVLFAPQVNDTHKHRIMAEPKRLGRRINLTFFIRPLPNQNLRGFLQQPASKPGVLVPSFQEAEVVYGSKNQHSKQNHRQEIEVFEEDNGSVTTTINGVEITFATMEELLLNLNGHM